MPVTSWSTSPSSNNSAPPNGWPEGMAAAAVNDTARQQMADLVIEFQKNSVKVLGTVAGTDTITAAMTPALTAYSDQMFVLLSPANTNTGAATLNVNSLGARTIRKGNGAALVAGDLVAGIPAFLVADDSASGWVLLNPQTWNGVGVTASGNVSVGGTLSVTGALTLNGALTTDNSSADEVGYKGLPQLALGSSGTLDLTTTAHNVHHVAAAGAGNTLTIPANASVAYPVGTAIVFTNDSTNSVSIAITSDTMTLAGTTSTGTRVLAQNGMATALKITTTKWLISGTGLT